MGIEVAISVKLVLMQDYEMTRVSNELHRSKVSPSGPHRAGLHMRSEHRTFLHDHYAYTHSGDMFV